MPYYSLYGLSIYSALPLQQQRIIPATAVDAAIRFGGVNPQGLDNIQQEGFCFQANTTAFWLAIPSIGRFLVTNGAEIVIDPVKGIDEASLAAFVFGLCFEILLKQRELFVAPGFAIQQNRHGVAFMGLAGLGFSRVKAAFFKRGCAFISTSFFALNAVFEVLPGLSQIAFPTELIKSLDRDPTALTACRSGIEQYLVPLENPSFLAPLPLNRIYLLKPLQKSELVFVPLVEKKGQHIEQAALHHPSYRLYNAQATKVLQAIDLFAIHMPSKGLHLDDLINAIENHMLDREPSNVCN